MPNPNLTVTVELRVLSERVRQNRERHREVFLAAIDGYRQRVIEHLENQLRRFKQGKVGRIEVFLPVPEDHTKDYDRVLAMLGMHQGDSIEIAQEDFARFVMDDWSWKREFLGTASNYTQVEE